MLIGHISDTHNRHKELSIPKCDILIHSGDFCNGESSGLKFLHWLSKQEAKHKILVAGNHDCWVEKIGKANMKRKCNEFGIIYLQDEAIELYGLKFYGTPWSVSFRNWCFMAEEEELVKYWDKIPLDTDVLITHTPQFGVLDKFMEGGVPLHLGSRSLERRIQLLNKLKLHFFGHIHGETGIEEVNKFRNYVSCNGAALWEHYQHREDVKGPLIIEFNF